MIEFNVHQREVFCVFSGVGVNKLRNFLNQESLQYDTEGTMYDDADLEEEADEQQVAGMMHATGLGGDDDEMDEENEGGEGSQDGVDQEGWRWTWYDRYQDRWFARDRSGA